MATSNDRSTEVENSTSMALKGLTSILLIFSILGCKSIPVKQMTHLHWGQNLKSPELSPIAIAPSTYKIHVVSKIQREDILNSGAEYHNSDQALADLKIIFTWSLCTHLKDHLTTVKCGTSAKKAILLWVDTYKPSGRPIDDNELIPVLLSIDLVWNKFSAEEKNKISSWLELFIKLGDEEYIKKSEKSASRINNHNTWRLTIRALAAKILGDPKAIEETKKLINEHAQNNLSENIQYRKKYACKNNQNISNYGSFDFWQRDALHYHIYNLQAWLVLAALTPELLTKNSSDLIIKALSFLDPYLSGKQTHIEFICSKIDIDIERRKAGLTKFQNQAWNKSHYKTIVPLANLLQMRINTNENIDQSAPTKYFIYSMIELLQKPNFLKSEK